MKNERLLHQLPHLDALEFGRKELHPRKRIEHGDDERLLRPFQNLDRLDIHAAECVDGERRNDLASTFAFFSESGYTGHTLPGACIAGLSTSCSRYAGP